MLRFRITKDQRAHWKWQDRVKGRVGDTNATVGPVEAVDIDKPPPAQRAALVRLASMVGLTPKDLTTDLKMEHCNERVVDVFCNYWPEHGDWIAWEDFLATVHKWAAGRKARSA